MHLACCQFNPRWGDRESNIEKADRLLADYQQGDIDVLVLPEMAFTGYVFHTKSEVEPYLEDTMTGPTVQWAQRQARRLACYIAAGYPERHADEVTGKVTYFNSMCFVNRQGQLLKTYRKAFLYETDETWASEGQGFETMDVDDLGKIGFGICMDLNPYQFKADFWDMEFAKFHVNQKTDILLCCMAWLRSKTESVNKEKEVINYWGTRLLPLLKRSDGHRTVFVACNRSGHERGSTFAGASAVLELTDQALLVDYLTEDVEGVMVVDI
ncbi:carbon-nitrogen hydrolase [Hesseltinella vesiculosa]|uniref:Carbon-nitrogen hydrolase n=1 Tax=Hesseltinella vesiculosa TaxID=101127 RepID=A0A1X2GDD6_9FUNG|nr:carbon-nitrogen hydrolase [Hesseltinella vesiculosa]